MIGIKCLHLQILDDTLVNANGGIFYMKATGIVRRIDETAIIGPSQKNLVKSMGFADLVFLFYGSEDECVN